MSKLAYSYTRFSSEKQTLGSSVVRQDKLATAYALKHGLELDNHSYRDLGVSAFRGENVKDGALGAFLKAVDDGLIPKGVMLLVENIDRLSRDTVDVAMELFLGIMRRGITIVSLKDDRVYSTETVQQDQGMGMIISILQMVRAHEESDVKRKRVKIGQAEARQEKRVTRNCPAWLKVDATGSKYVLVADKVKVVRKLFQLAVEGNGIFLIHKYALKHNLVQMGEAKGWTPQAVARILHSQSVIGQLVSKANNEVIEDFYPAIIDRETFYTVQEKIAQRDTVGHGRKGASVANLFSGLNRCGDCDRAMRFLRIPSGGHLNSYLECLNQVEGKGCRAPKINYERVERAVLSELLISQGLEGLTPIKIVDPAIPIRGELADKRAQIEKLNELIEASPPRVAKNLLGRLDRFLEEAEALEKSLREVSVQSYQASETLSALADAMALWKRHATAEGEELREIRFQLQSQIKMFVERIDLPSRVYAPYGEKYRAALIKLRGLNLKRLKKPKAGVVAAQYPEADIYDALSTPTEQLSKADDVLTVYYEVPKMGNQGNVGERRRRKGKFVS